MSGSMDGREEVNSPLVPLDTWLCNKSGEGLWKRSTRNGDGEPAALVDRLLLSFNDVLCEGIGEL